MSLEFSTSVMGSLVAFASVVLSASQQVMTGALQREYGTSSMDLLARVMPVQVRSYEHTNITITALHDHNFTLHHARITYTHMQCAPMGADRH